MPPRHCQHSLICSSSTPTSKAAGLLSCYAGERQGVPNYGRVLVDTPNIDCLAREGVRLTRFFTNSAVCTPSRGCFFTGRYPHCHGTYRNDVPINRDEQTIARMLEAAGYDTGYCGKRHLDGQPKPGFMTPERSMGFADCRFMFNRGHWKKMEVRPDGRPREHVYNIIGDATTDTTDWLTNHAMDFVSRQRKRPFFYYESAGLDNKNSHFYFTLRPGNNRKAQTGPLYWDADEGETGSRQGNGEDGPRSPVGPAAAAAFAEEGLQIVGIVHGPVPETGLEVTHPVWLGGAQGEDESQREGWESAATYRPGTM